MLYLDSSALVKLVVPEPESDALLDLLETSTNEVSSIVAAVEVPRAVARVTADPGAHRRADDVLAGVDLRALDTGIVAATRSIEPTLRSLDAIHLATAISLGDVLSGLVAYDRRLQDAARGAGLEVLAPA